MATPKRNQRKPHTQVTARREKGRGKKASNGTHAPATPWDEFLGMFKNDQDFARVKQHMAEHRRRRDADATLP